MPLLCGLQTGVVSGNRPIHRRDVRLFGGVRRAVIAQILNRSGRVCLSEAFLDGFEHDVTAAIPAVNQAG